jgi:hypothetical protein
MKKNILLSLMLCAFGFSASAIEYTWTWNGTSSNEFQTTANWDISPAPDANTAAMVFPRNLLGNTSVVVFNKNANVNLPSDYGTSFFINEMRILSGNVSFTKPSLGNIEIGFDGLGLNINSGAKLTLVCDAQGIKLLMNASANNCTIAGTLDLSGSASSGGPAKLEKPNFVNPVWTVASGGKIILSGLNAQVLSATPTSLKFLSGSSMDITRNGGTIPTADYQVGSTINITGSTSAIAQFSNSYDSFSGDIVWNCPSQTVTTFSAQWSLSTGLPTNFKGNFFMKAGYLRMIGAGLSLQTFAGLNVSGGTLEFGNTSGTLTPSVVGNVSVTGGNLRITSSDFTGGVALTVNGQITQAGGTINLSPGSANGTINLVGGGITQSAGTLTESGSSTLSSFVFKGTNLQTATFLGTVSGDKFIVIVNNGKKHVSLLSSVVLPYRLQCTAGDMIIADNNLTVTEKVLGSRAAGGVVTNGQGTLTLKAVDNIGKDFPVKTSSASHDAVYITNATGTSDYSVRVSPFILPVTNLNLANTLPRQWKIISTSTAANLEFDPDPISGTIVTTAPHSIGQLVGTTWNQSTATVGVNNGYLFANDFTSFTEFVVGTTNVIPVELTEFMAKYTTNSNQLTWTTATERNVERFDVQRSNDGVNNWQSIGSVKAKGNSAALLNYQFADETPFRTSYYRLTTIDVDGKTDVSKTVSVNRLNSGKLTLTKAILSLYTEGSPLELNINTEKASTVYVALTDALGRVVLTKNFSTTDGANQIQLPISGLAKGVYFLNITDGDGKISAKIVRQ